MELKRIDALSCGKMLGAMYAGMGIIFGGIMAAVSMLGAVAAPQVQNGNNPLFVFGAGLGALILLPLFYGVLGFLGGIVSAFIYNLVAGVVGGIVVEFQQTQDYLQ